MLLIIAVLLIIVAAVWYLKPGWLSKESRDRATSAVTASTARPRGWLGKIRLPFQKDNELATQFKQWVDQAELSKQTKFYKELPSDAAEFTAWLEDLSEDKLTEFVEELSAFCRAQGFKLAWLMDPNTPDNMKGAVEDAVLLHSLAAWRARDIQPLLAYKAWQAAPNKPENQAFGQRLYGKLVEAGLATAPADLMLASAKERQAYVAQAINAAAAEHQDTFLALVKEVSSELETEMQEPEKEAADGSAVETSTTTAAEIAA